MSKIRDAVLGFVVGDAFGVPYEFLKRGAFRVDENMIGYGSHHQPVGTWSDDSSMMLATLFSMVYKQDVVLNFLDWYKHGEFTPHGMVFDIGGRTATALKYYEKNHEFMPDTEETALGNGSLMRILPLAFVNWGEDSIDTASSITHPARICREACKIYVRIIRGLISGFSLNDMMFDSDFTDEFERLSYISTLDKDDIKSTGYVVDTLEAAIWSVIKTNSYKDAIILATSLGDDTDTIAALTGAMAGIIYGAESIPEQWLFNIARLDDIEKLIEKSQDELVF